MNLTLKGVKIAVNQFKSELLPGFKNSHQPILLNFCDCDTGEIRQINLNKLTNYKLNKFKKEMNIDRVTILIDNPSYEIYKDFSINK